MSLLNGIGNGAFGVVDYFGQKSEGYDDVHSISHAVGSTTGQVLGWDAGAGIGAGIGTAVGTVAAPFTGGASIPIGAAIGGFGGGLIGSWLGGSAGSAITDGADNLIRGNDSGHNTKNDKGNSNMYSNSQPYDPNKYSMNNPNNTDQQNGSDAFGDLLKLGSGLATTAAAGSSVYNSTFANTVTSPIEHFQNAVKMGIPTNDALGATVKQFGENGLQALKGMPWWGKVAAGVLAATTANSALGNPIGGTVDAVTGSNYTGRQNLPGSDPTRSYPGSDRVYGDTPNPQTQQQTIDSARGIQNTQEQYLQQHLDQSLAVGREADERKRRSSMMQLNANQASDLLRSYDNQSNTANTALNSIINMRF